MKHFKILLTFFSLFALFFLVKQASIAQTCGGSPTCSSTQYSDPPTFYCRDSSCIQPIYTCYTCESYTITDSSASCRIWSGQNVCSACVPADQICSLNNEAILTGVYSYPDGYPIPYPVDCYSNVNVQDAPEQSYCPDNTLKPCQSGCTTACNQAPYVNCGACGGGYEPTNTCGSTTGGYSCQYGGPGACTPSGNPTFSCTQGYNNCSNNYYCPGGAGFQQSCQTHVTAHAFVDTNHDGNQDPGEPNLQGVVMNDNGNQITTNSSGDSVYSGYTSGTTVYIEGDATTPLRGWYFKDTSMTHSVTLNNSNGNPTLNYAFVPMFTISGRIYIDQNYNGDGTGDPNYTATRVQVTDGTHTVSTDGNGNFSFTKEEINGNYTISIVASSIPNGYVGETTSQKVTVNGADVGGVDLGITPIWVKGYVYTDYNHNGVKDGGDVGTNNVAVALQNTAFNDTTDSTGAYSITPDTVGTYTVQDTVPGGFAATNNVTTHTVTISKATPQITEIFYITPLYQISGTIFNDFDLSHCYNPSSHGCTYNGNTYAAGVDTPFTNGSHLIITGPTNTTADATNGLYQTSQTLLSGTYSVRYDTGTTPLPAGYKFVGPSSWTNIVLGNPASNQTGYMCDNGASPDGTCGNPNNGSISNLNFGVTNENVWQQPCGDTRNENGYSEEVPATASCGSPATSAPYDLYCPATPNNSGILFSGNTNPTYGTGTGYSPSNNVIGDFAFPEFYQYHLPNTSDTSFDFINTTLNNVATTPVPLKSICANLSSCQISADKLATGVVYTTTAADGPVTLTEVNNLDGSFNLGNKNYTFLIGGDLTFASNIMVNNGNSAAFISDGDIHVAPNVGETDWTSTAPDIEGFFSAGGSFYLDTNTTLGLQCNANGQPKDLKLNIVGSVTVNANGGGGSIVNNREGCLQDLTCPSTTIQSDPVMILHAPGTLKPGYSFWQELNP